MALFDLLRRRDRDPASPLYDAVVTRARAPHWYVEGGVPDTLDGRFDMVAAVLAMVLLRFEEEPGAANLSVALTERFVDDMDAQVRQIGFGDMVVGKQIGKMVSMLGGRLGAYRDGISAGSLDDALVRNLWRGAAPPEAAVRHVSESLLALRAALGDVPLATLAAGTLP